MYKFREDELIEEFRQYVESTYGQHYATDKYQATDIIIDSGHGAGFCLGNVIKYAKRYGKKGSPEEQRKDIMKIMHYALIQLFNHDEQHEGTSIQRKLDLWGITNHEAEVEYHVKLNGDSIDDAKPNEWDLAAKSFRKKEKSDYDW